MARDATHKKNENTIDTMRSAVGVEIWQDDGGVAGVTEVAAMATEVEAYEAWRHGRLREDLAKLTARYEERAGSRKRAALAGPALLPRAPPDGTVRVATATAAKPRRLRRIKRSVAPLTDPESGAVRRPKRGPPGRFVCDQFATPAEVGAVLSCSQNCDWWHSPHSFETVPLASFVADAARLPGGTDAVRCVRELRDAARVCVCEALGVDRVLYHAHATLTRTRSPSAAPQYSDEDALRLFEAIELKDRANAEYRRGMYEPAIQLYTDALAVLPESLKRTHPEVALILSNRAACHNQLQDYRQVIADTTAALDIDPVNLKALMRRGFAYEAIERYPAALADMETVGRLAPRTSEAIRAAGRLRGLVKAWDKITAQEEAESGGPIARPPSLDSWEVSADDAGQSEGAAGGREQEEDVAAATAAAAGLLQFNGPHADMASVVHYDYSAVLYLTSSSAAATSADDDGKNEKSRRGRPSGFDGGTFVFCDGDADRTIVPREGRLVGFSSGKSEKTVSFCAIFAPRI